MTTLTKIKGKVVNPDLPVVTKYGLLSQIVGKYANKLDAVGVDLTQTELTALGVFVDTLKDAGILEQVTAFYPFIGNPNIPLLGLKELQFTDLSTSNNQLVFSNGKIIGYTYLPEMSDVKVVDLAPNILTNGLMVAGSMLYAVPSSASVVAYCVNFKSANSSLGLQYRMSLANKFAIYSFNSDGSDYSNGQITFVPALESSPYMDSYCFAHGLTANALATNKYNRTIIKNGTILTNIDGQDTSKCLNTSGYENLQVHANTNNLDLGMKYTTLAFFDTILTRQQSLAFCQALNDFVNAVGKTTV